MEGLDMFSLIDLQQDSSFRDHPAYGENKELTYNKHSTMNSQFLRQVSQPQIRTPDYR
jgi:hypothetical protein